jgi:hypothetical protein
MTHIAVLLHNGWIRLCSGAWGSTIVLAAKPHHEHVLYMLIVVPQSLRRDVFSAYHATPIAGHMGVYKTLHRIRL